MCELLGLSSRKPVRLTFSLETLASHSTPPASQRDGWGAAFYQGNDVALFREPIAANESPLVHFLETNGPSTTLAISHIRHATKGELILANTQPFLREVAGRTHVFAHNGNLVGIEQTQEFIPNRYRPVGTTDSELAFCALLERQQYLTESSPLSERLTIVKKFAADLSKLGTANFLYSDGELLFAHGDRRLQSVTGEITAPGLFLYYCRCEDNEARMETQGLSIAAGFQEVVLVASVPLTNELSYWRPLGEGEIVVIAKGKVLDVV